LSLHPAGHGRAGRRAGRPGVDRYAYVNNNPARFNDPSGHCIDPDNCPWRKDPLTTDQASSVQKLSTPRTTISAAPTPVPTPPTTLFTGPTPSPTPYTTIGAIERKTIIIEWEYLIDWNKVDMVDFWIDIGGLVGQVAPLINQPVGTVGFGISEVAEGAGFVKGGIDLINGDPSNLTLTTIEKSVLPVLVDAARLHPSWGFAFNIWSLGINLGPAFNSDAIKTFGY
jgi:hypothetical protein